jgi:hypothetical protein
MVWVMTGPGASCALAKTGQDGTCFVKIVVAITKSISDVGKWHLAVVDCTAGMTNGSTVAYGCMDFAWRTVNTNIKQKHE